MAGGIRARIISRLSRVRYVREAMAERAALATLHGKPTPRVWTGLGLIGLSYIIGWPTVGLLALISYYTREPLIVAIGGPLTYGLSYPVFMAGFYLAGSRYASIIFRWATWNAMERWGGNVAPVGSESAGRGTFSPAHGTGVIAFLLSGVLFLLFGGKVAAFPLGVFILLCLAAPFFPRWGFFLPVVSRGGSGVKAVALTFDDGPDPEVIPLLLGLLERHGAAATFFVIGRKAEGNPALIREILLRGHAIGNHSYRHDPLLMLRSSARLAEEIARTQRLLTDFGIQSLVFRPPVGITNPRLPKALRELNLDCVTFSCRACDFGNRRIKGLAETLLKKIHPGAIVLLHDIPPWGRGVMDWIEEVDRLILGLKSRGYKVVPLSELIGRPVMEPLGTCPPKS